MAFDPRSEVVLDALLARLAKNDPSKMQALAPADRQRLVAHVAGVAECLTVGIVFLQGFEEIAAGGPLRAQVPSETQKWVDSVPRKQSGCRIAGMMASSICSVLEGFIFVAGSARLTNSRLEMIRAAGYKVSPDDAKARTDLLKSVKPSVHKKGKEWIEALKLVFSVALTPEEDETLVDMITFRNQYVHDPSTALSLVITGEQLKCWAVATETLCYRIVIS